MTRRRWLRLRTRFVAAGVLLALTTVAASSWTVIELTELTTATAAIVIQIDETAVAAAATESAIEREDDALLQVLGAETAGGTVLSIARELTDSTIDRLDPGVGALRTALDNYRRAADHLAAAPGSSQLGDYRQQVNPLLRAVLHEVAVVRDSRIDAARQAATRARDGIASAQRIVAGVAATALLIAAVVALRLARQILGPIKALAVAASRVRDGDFTSTITAMPGDELGEVADAFNAMTQRIGEFRRSDLGQVMRANATLEAVLQALPDAVLRFDGSGRVAAANPAAVRLFATLGQPTPTDEDEVVRALAGGDPRTAAALTGPPVPGPAPAAIRLGSDPDVRHLRARIIPLPEGDGASGRLLVLSDVTDLARLDELRSELVAVASHELRTPVTTLRMSLLMLRETAASLPDRASALVDTALVGVESLRETVDELLDLTRIESGRLRLYTERIDLPALLRSCLDRHRERAAELGVELELAGAGCPAMVADPARLRLVFDNLLRNALHYTPRGGRVLVAVGTATSAASMVEVSITDTGPGVPEPFRERIFEKFFRIEHVRPSGDDARGGAGIGLFLCRQIVGLHGGAIHCLAGPGDRGARFVLTLPGAA